LKGERAEAEAVGPLLKPERELPGMMVDLSRDDYSPDRVERGRLARVLWSFFNGVFVKNPLNPSSGIKAGLLRLFGAKVGKGVVLKPSIDIRHPWNVEIGDFSWVGEGARLSSPGKIRIGKRCCISQDACLCAGYRDGAEPASGLIVYPIVIEDGARVGAGATVLPGVTVGSHANIRAGSVLKQDAEPCKTYAGNPAQKVIERAIRDKGGPSPKVIVKIRGW